MDTFHRYYYDTFIYLQYILQTSLRLLWGIARVYQIENLLCRLFQRAPIALIEAMRNQAHPVMRPVEPISNVTRQRRIASP